MTDDRAVTAPPITAEELANLKGAIARVADEDLEHAAVEMEMALRLIARIEELEAAIRPFADAVKILEAAGKNGSSEWRGEARARPWGRALLKARAALYQENQ